MKAEVSALVLVLVLPGCTFLAPAPRMGDIIEDEGAEHPIVREGDGPICGRVTLAAPERVRVGEAVAIEASLTNCGNNTLQIDRGLCPDEGAGFRLLVRSGFHEWHLHARDVPEAAALHDAPCRRGGSSIFGLPPSRADVPIAHVVTFRWNGTFATDPCHPSPISHAAACLQYGPALPGEYDLRARIEASGVFWHANATLVVEGEPPSTPEPCSRLSLAQENDTHIAFVARVENCGDTYLTLDPTIACTEGYPMRMRLVQGEREWALAHHTAITEVGCSAEVDERIVPPGGFAWSRTLWNGEIDGEPAPPGPYEVVATVRVRWWAAENAEARLPIDVV